MKKIKRNVKKQRIKRKKQVHKIQKKIPFFYAKVFKNLMFLNLTVMKLVSQKT